MSQARINELLREAATIYVAEADEWEKTYGNKSEEFNLPIPSGHFLEGEGPNGEKEEYTVQEWKYNRLMADVKAVFARVTPELVALGYVSPTHTISGCASSDISHYDMDDLVIEKFGDRVQTDSESGCFFAYTDAEMAPALLEYVNEIGGANEGKEWTTYGGDVDPASFGIREDEDISIKGLENWSCGRNLLKQLDLAEQTGV